MICKNKGYQMFMNILLTFLVLSCVIPLMLLVASSFTSEATLTKEGYSLLPKDFSLSAYAYLWNTRSAIIRAYLMSFIITGIGTVANIILTMLFAYPLSRKDLPGRSGLSFFLFFTMLFNGGFVPTYLIYSNIFHVNDTLAGLIIPYLLMNPFYVIMTRSYIMNNVPSEVMEAARSDGAGEMKILTSIVIPMSKPILATVGLMSAIAYWNNWTNGVYFISARKDLHGIQNFLNTVMSNAAFLQSHANVVVNVRQIPSVSLRMAIAVIAILPILAMYPFFQKSFVKGITVGSVKG